ncbi:sigma-70 family RNA polymerase sigma factor [Clostridium sp. LIBA-8841]|uniref:sigma-70 family RNA polymerase sigma factor n=1 Tax=Clostridium sp. LIBA-8841 TaxID=2987530 RepID=UPI002AC71697|nr:sigma-70 family RNA polymerase sigma factor [Clostridium sp. LIBA-8841]MDZ5255150.1 sigma-70 family RNA polymerase sigma factor [Clostridium sp. LIBA-8841]
MNDGFENDGSIVKYINKAIVHRKKDMSINKRRKLDDLICTYEFDLNEFKDDSNILLVDSNILINDLLKTLTEKEKKVIQYKFIKGRSDVEIGEMLDISRQAVNKTKNRALKKLKDVI